jgi:hypothetical protein
MKFKIFFCHFLNPWALRVSGMGGYTSKCEKKSKSLHPIVYAGGRGGMHIGLEVRETCGNKSLISLFYSYMILRIP